MITTFIFIGSTCRADVVDVVSNLNATFAGLTLMDWSQMPSSFPYFTISFSTNGSSGSGSFNTLSLNLAINSGTLTAFSANINGGATRNATLTLLTTPRLETYYRANFNISDLTYTNNTNFSWALQNVNYAGTGINSVDDIRLTNTNGSFAYATGFQNASTNYDVGGLNNIQFAVSVPEPGTLVLGCLALIAGGGAAVRRYRKMQQAESDSSSNHDNLKNAE